MNYLLIPKMKVEGASALSSSYTIGIPAMQSWLGLMYIMQRKLREMYPDKYSKIYFSSLGVCYHELRVRRHWSIKNHKPQYVYTIIGSRNPMIKTNSGIGTAPFIEMPVIDMTVDLVISIGGVDGDDLKEDFKHIISNLLNILRACGGNIVSFREPDIVGVSNYKEDEHLRNKMTPGFAIIERRDLLISGEASNDIDRLLNAITLKCTAKKDANGKVVKWNYKRAQDGWIIPIAVGYKGISALDKVKNQRDNNHPHRFVESITTLGECKMPCKLDCIEDMMWRFEYNEEDSLYICKNQLLDRE